MRVHNDIDARNILVLPTGDVRLGGFCYSTKNLGMSQKFSGPYIHMSPERLLGLSCGFASDSWSVGILAMELLTGKVGCCQNVSNVPCASVLEQISFWMGD